MMLVQSQFVSMFHGCSFHGANVPNRFCPSVCEVDHARRRTEVLLQIDHIIISTFVKCLPEFSNNLDFCAPKTIDCLTMIANCRQLSRVPAQQVDQIVLSWVDILDF